MDSLARRRSKGDIMLSTAQKERLVRLVTQEADILIDDVRTGRFRKFSANYLREIVRCKHGESFTNTVSPIVYDEVKRRRPDLKNWMDT